jgi:hypothetical protein
MATINKEGSRAELQPRLSAYDIRGAFLVTPMGVNVRMFIRLSSDLLDHWLARYPERKEFVHTDGCLYFELKKYLYGLHESPREFNNLQNQKIQEIGFKPTVADRCLYTKETPDGLIVLRLHVDDMLLLTPITKYRDWFEREMEKAFEVVKQHDTLSFLSLSI